MNPISLHASSVQTPKINKLRVWRFLSRFVACVDLVFALFVAGLLILVGMELTTIYQDTNHTPVQLPPISQDKTCRALDSEYYANFYTNWFQNVLDAEGRFAVSMLGSITILVLVAALISFVSGSILLLKATKKSTDKKEAVFCGFVWLVRNFGLIGLWIFSSLTIVPGSFRCQPPSLVHTTSVFVITRLLFLLFVGKLCDELKLRGASEQKDLEAVVEVDKQ